MPTYYVDWAAGDDTTGDGSSGLPWKTLSKAATVVAAGDVVYAKASGSYAEKVSLTASGTEYNPIRWYGYTATPGDNGQATITGSGSRTSCIDSQTTSYNVWYNFHLTASTTGIIQFDASALRVMDFVNCKFTKGGSSPALVSTTAGFNRLAAKLYGCEIDGMAVNVAGNGLDGASEFVGCYIHDITGAGITWAAFNDCHGVQNCVFDTITGDAINVGASDTCKGPFSHNTFYNIGGDAIEINGSTNGSVRLVNNIFSVITGKPFRTGALSSGTSLIFVNNRYHSYGTAPDVSSARINIGGADLTGSPFTDPANGNFTLNNTAGAGADCREVAYPTALAGQSNFLDVGALQHEPTGGGLMVHPGMRGRMAGL